MYLLLSKIYPWRNLEISSSDFGIISKDLMCEILKETNMKSIEEFIEMFNGLSENNIKLRKQIITSIWKLELQRKYPIVKISKITSS